HSLGVVAGHSASEDARNRAVVPAIPIIFAVIGPRGTSPRVTVARGVNVVNQFQLGWQDVLDYFSVLHVYHDVLVRLGDQPDVVNGITVDHQQIGKRPLFDDPQLSRVGVARTGHRQELGVDGSRHLQDVDIVVPAGQMGQHEALALGQLAGKQQV